MIANFESRHKFTLQFRQPTNYNKKPGAGRASLHRQNDGHKEWQGNESQREDQECRRPFQIIRFEVAPLCPYRLLSNQIFDPWAQGF